MLDLRCCKWTIITFPVKSSIQFYLSRGVQDFSSKSEAYASELLENLEEMFPLYYTWIVICVISSNNMQLTLLRRVTHQCVVGHSTY